MLNFTQGQTNTQNSHVIEEKIRSAVNATGLAAGFTGTSIDAISAITKEIGFTATKFASVGKIGAAGEKPWDDAATLNAISTGLSIVALVPGPHSIICGGLSVMIGIVGTAYLNNYNNSSEKYAQELSYDWN